MFTLFRLRVSVVECKRQYHKELPTDAPRCGVSVTQVSAPDVLPLVLRPYGDEQALLGELLQFQECHMATALADTFKGRAAKTVVGGKVLIETICDSGIREFLVACGASTHNGG